MAKQFQRIHDTKALDNLLDNSKRAASGHFQTQQFVSNQRGGLS